LFFVIFLSLALHPNFALILFVLLLFKSGSIENLNQLNNPVLNLLEPAAEENAASKFKSCDNHDDGVTEATFTCSTCDENLCADCDRVMHLPKSKRGHRRMAIISDALTVDAKEGCARIKLSTIFVVLDMAKCKVLVQLRQVSRGIDYILSLSFTFSSSNLLKNLFFYQGEQASSATCRFCGASLIGDSPQHVADSPALQAVCGAKECMEKATLSCGRIHKCGHICHGVSGENLCLPCLHGCKETSSSDLLLPTPASSSTSSSSSPSEKEKEKEKENEAEKEKEKEKEKKLTQDVDDMCMICWTDSLGKSKIHSQASLLPFHLSSCASFFSPLFHFTLLPRSLTIPSLSFLFLPPQYLLVSSTAGEAPSVQLECGHVFHYKCTLDLLQKRWNGARITFGFAHCPICKQKIEHELLESETKPIWNLYQDVSSKALLRIEYLNLHQDDEVVKPGGKFYNGKSCFTPSYSSSLPPLTPSFFSSDLGGYAMDRLCYYMCHKCKKPYFGGERQCAAAAPDNFNPEELVCAGCSSGSTEQNCPKHGKVCKPSTLSSLPSSCTVQVHFLSLPALLHLLPLLSLPFLFFLCLTLYFWFYLFQDFLDFKCRFCCSVAVWFCFGTTHFCDPCHNNHSHLTGLAKEDMPQCPVGPGPVRLAGDDCPLLVKHPPTGEEFALGCGICRNTRSF
jgi:hypothetical protein